MPGTVIENEPSYKLSIQIGTMLHLHDLYHVQINWLSDCRSTCCIFWWCTRSNGEDGIHNIRSQLLGEARLQLSCKRSVSNVYKSCTIEGLLDLVGVEKLTTDSERMPWIIWTNRALTASASFFAMSNPSATTVGCTPSEIYLSACFNSSPTSRTTDVVPSPTWSSCATAVRAIMAAVGFWQIS